MVQQILDFFRKLFDTSDWPARWHCGRWSDFHGWLYIISDLLVWGAYFAIPLIILTYVRRKELPFERIYFLFAAFILACGTTHLIDAVMFWQPIYRISALVRLGTGIVSWVTVLSLLRVLPVAFALKSPKEFQQEIDLRKDAENSLREKNDLLNEAQQLGKIGHWERSLEGDQYITGSPEFARIFDFDPEQYRYLLNEFQAKVHPDDRQYVREQLNKILLEGALPVFFYRVLRPGGSILNVATRAELVRNRHGEPTKIIGIVQDVTQIREMEEELLLKSRELENRIGDLQRFAYMASHDMKEPLRKISMFASILEKQHADELSDRGRTILEKIVASALRQQQLIEETLTFARLTNQRPAFEKMSLRTLADDALADLEVLQTEAKAEVIIEDLPEAEVSPLQVKLLFQNLLSNAFKFRSPGQSARVRIWSEITDFNGAGFASALPERYFLLGNPNWWEREKFCRIYIEDKGIGFDEKYRDMIFEIFKRIQSAEQYEGSGLGLAICKKIVENHHGLIQAESKPGEGAVFIVILPLSQKGFRGSN